MSDLAKVVGEDAEHLWEYLPFKKVYYKDKEPYGVIGTFPDNGMTVIFSMAKNDKFTVGMLKDVFKLYNTMDIALVTDTESSFDYIKGILKPYGFVFSMAETDTGQKFMYSIHHKEDK